MYVIAQLSGSKKSQLFKVKQNGSIYNGTLADHTRWSGETYTIKSNEVVLHLGDDPKMGKAYDCWIEPVKKRIDVKGYGEIFFYSTPSEKSEARTCRAFVDSLKFVRDLGPQCDWDILTEVRNHKGGKRRGQYAYKSKGQDTLTLFDLEGQTSQELKYVIVHELAHGVWFRYLTADERAEWIELYESFLDVETISPQQIKHMIKDIRSLQSIKEFVKNSEPETTENLKSYMRWLDKVHDISRWSFQDLLASKDAKIPMPDTHLHKANKNIPVKCFTKDSAEEMFAEVLACYATDALESKSMIKMLRSLK